MTDADAPPAAPSAVHDLALTAETAGSIPIHLVTADGLEALGTHSSRTVAWADATGFKGKPGDLCLVPGEDGSLARVLQGHDPDSPPIWTVADLPRRLPAGTYALADPLDEDLQPLGWALGAYVYDVYKDASRAPAQLALPDGTDRPRLEATARAVCLARDLVNTPAQDMTPADLAEAAEAVGAAHGATVTTIVGDALLEQNYPAIHAVGRASAIAPRLIDLTWGPADAPKVTLVGKGVCFDSGGLDIKPASGMRLMKKDMGGAATALGLASLIMATDLPVRLRLLIPAVENAIAGNAFHPMDVIRTRKGVTVEIGHTDAEGRVILSDALAEASSEAPDLLIDLATLTGAARVALGPDLPALFTGDDDLAADILAAGTDCADPLWRLPLWDGYRTKVDGDTADITNSPDWPFAGAITAALFLREFVDPGVTWAHIDTFAWNGEARPGRPKGGEAMALRAVYQVIRDRFRG